MLVLTLLFAATATAYVWPSPKLDALEAMRWDQDTTGFAAFFQPCNEFNFGTSTGRANGPDWIRTVSLFQIRHRELIWYGGQAYHNMATHNTDDGTGGLDASIRFSEELSRPEVAPFPKDRTSHTDRSYFRRIPELVSAILSPSLSLSHPAIFPVRVTLPS